MYYDVEKMVVKGQLEKFDHEKDKDEAILDKIRNIVLDVAKAKQEYLKGSPESKNTVANKLLWNLSVQNQKVLSFQAKEPFNILLNGPKIDSVSCLQRIVRLIRTNIWEQKGYIYIPSLV